MSRTRSTYSLPLGQLTFCLLRHLGWRTDTQWGCMVKSFRKCCSGLYSDRTCDWLSWPLRPLESIFSVIQSQHRAATFAVCPWPWAHIQRKVRGYQSAGLMQSLTPKVSSGLLKRHYCVSISGARARGVEVMSLSCLLSGWREDCEVFRWNEEQTGSSRPDGRREKHICHIHRVQSMEHKETKKKIWNWM